MSLLARRARCSTTCDDAAVRPTRRSAVGNNGAVDTVAKKLRHRIVVAAAVCLLSAGCTSTVTGSALRDPAVAPTNVPPLNEAALDDVLLSIDHLAGIVGAPELESLTELDQMSDNSGAVSDPDCLGAIFGAEETVYDGSDWTAVRDQVADDPNQDGQHWVEQTAVLYTSEAQARQFFDDAATSWGDCANFSVSVADSETSYIWRVEDLDARDDVIAQVTTQEESNGWQCQHALAVVSNLTAETWACSFDAADGANEAVEIAEAMVANAAG